MGVQTVVRDCISRQAAHITKICGEGFSISSIVSASH